MTSRANPGMRVALVDMPFSAADRPSLALGLLQAVLKQRGIDCTTRHLNLAFAQFIGHAAYRRLSELADTTALAGEWIFSQAFYGERLSDWVRYEREVLSHPVWGMSDDCRDLVRHAARVAPRFLDFVFEASRWDRYDVVGFTSTFEQTMAVMCLARMIKSASPETRIVVGGANVADSMGPPYLEIFPFIDYVCVGEGESALPELCDMIAGGGTELPPGIVSRDRPEPRSAGVPARMDALPYPDFDDFFRVFPHSGQTCSCLPVEASRGCWWGQKSHCTFCGLNARMMEFREKSAQRILDEVSCLESRYRPGRITFTDNILSRNHLKTVVPAWARDDGGGTPRFFETKANLSREELVLLKRAGISIQPGIESLSDRSLRAMGKGVSAAQNLALLRWCAEIGIEVVYNILFGFPDEALSEYPALLELLQDITHLPPPRICWPVRMDRFSPNFEHWRERGFTGVRPMPAYRHVFDAPEDVLSQIACFFEYEHAHSERVMDLAQPMIALVREWQERRRTGTAGAFAIQPSAPGRWLLLDSRFNHRARRIRLGRGQVVAAVLADRPIGRERLLAAAWACGLDGPGSLAALEELQELGVVRAVGGSFVTVAALPDEVRDSVARPSPIRPEDHAPGADTCRAPG